jgi:hypothetical protein
MSRAKSIWRLGGRLDGGATYFFYFLVTLPDGSHMVPDGQIISVADFWGKAA